MSNKIFKNAFAEKGDKTAIPDTPVDDRVNYEQGYTPAYSDDPATGGQYVDRKSFNGIINDITTAIMFLQRNTFPAWIADKGDGEPVSYPINAIVNYNNKPYFSTVENNKDEPTKTETWLPTAFKQTDLLPIGAIVPFVGAIQPEGWLFCDGRAYDPTIYPELAKVLSAMGTHTTPNITNKYLRGASSVQAGSMCKFIQASVGSHEHTATAKLPRHDHDTGSYRVYGRFGTSGLTRDMSILDVTEGAISKWTRGTTEAYGGSYNRNGWLGTIDTNANDKAGFTGRSGLSDDTDIPIQTDLMPVTTNEVNSFLLNYIIKAKHVGAKY